MPTVLAAFAHPDDMELLAGGTLKLLVDRGWTLRVVTLTGGDMGSATLSREAIRAQRLREAAAGAAALGGTHAWAGLDDFAIHYGPEPLAAVTEQVRRADPDLVITHAPADYLLDHEEGSKLVRMACFVAGVPLYRTATAPTTRGIPALYYADALEGKDAFGRPVVPGLWVDVTTTFKDRERALACHASQRDWLKAHHGVDEYLLANERMARANGARAGCTYAEGFRQHLGHAYPQANALADALGPLVRINPAV